MAGFYQFETASLRVKVTAEDGSNPLDGFRSIVVSLDQGDGRGMYHGDYAFEAGAPEVDIAEQTINLDFSQEETGKYAAMPARVQVNIYYDDAERDATVEGEIEVLENLYRKVMS